jgi:PBSX family phage portal protein
MTAQFPATGIEPKEEEWGRVTRALFYDDQGRPLGGIASQQIPDDPFVGKYGKTTEKRLKEPPFSLEQLVFLAEAHPVHSAALEQKASDVAGSGWKWEPLMDEAEEEVRDAIEDRFVRLSPDVHISEMLYAVWLDFESIGQGYIEVVRDAEGIVSALYHIPAHTVRACVDGKRFVQVRDNRETWFKMWGWDKVIDTKGNLVPDDHPRVERANDVIVIRKATRRSSYYGIPMWIAAMGWISLALAARDYNILYFENRREPRWLIQLLNVKDTPELHDVITELMRSQMKQPHRNIVVEVQGTGEIKLEKLTEDRPDLSFKELLLSCDDAILVAHRTPPDRVGITRSGPLGGSVAAVTNRVYREGVIKPSQDLLAWRINKFLEKEVWPHLELPKGAKQPAEAEAASKASGKMDMKALLAKAERRAGFGPVRKAHGDEKVDEPTWWWTPTELDLTEEQQDFDQADKAWVDGLAKLNEARAKAGWDPEDDPEIGDQYLWQLQGAAGPQPPGGDEEEGGQQPGGVKLGKARRQNEEMRSIVANAVARVDEALAELTGTGKSW